MKKIKWIQRILTMALSFALCVGAGNGRVYASFWSELWNQDPQEQPAPEPDLKMYTPQEPLTASFDITDKNLKCPAGTFEQAKRLYDGDETTVTEDDALTWVTLDTGELKTLAGLRFLPDRQDEKAANSCVGTRFYASQDNKSFHQLGIVEANGAQPLDGTWHEIIFSGVGEYRYFKVEMPAGARMAEIEWIEAVGWRYTPAAEGKQTLTAELTGFDAQRPIETDVLLAVYNKDGIMKQMSRAKQLFEPGTSATVTMTAENLTHEMGDSYRILVLEGNGASALPNTLAYQYTGASAPLTMSNIFSDHMMFQADKPLTIWGKAPTASTVEVSLRHESGSGPTRKTVVEKGSDWSVDLGSFSSGGSYTLEVKAGESRIEYQNITFGDVWLCMGQSNMDYYMLSGADSTAYLQTEQGKQEADNSQIRLVNLWNKGIEGSPAPVENLPINSWDNTWAPMNSDTANYCSAVAYYFAQGVQQSYGLPVGILSVAVGDTEINRWIPQGDRYGSFTSTDGGLYHNRIAPLEKLQIRGILMYQGEADQYRTHLSIGEYRDAMAGLVNHCRQIWGADLPFYWAQLTRYRVDESLIREAQRLALEKVQTKSNIGMIALIDLFGNYEGGTGSCREDIHPQNKEEVARRFLNLARRDVYEPGEPIAAVGPAYVSSRTAGGKIELTFRTTGDLKLLPQQQYADKVTDTLIAEQHINVQEPQEFEVAGADGVFVKASAQLRGNKVLVWSDEISNPVYVRYAWGAYPEIPNLTDDSGLPCPSFSTEKVQ